MRTEEGRWPTLSTRFRIPWNSTEVLGALYPVTDSWVSKIMSHNWQFPRKKIQTSYIHRGIRKQYATQ